MTHDPDTLERQGAEWASRKIAQAIASENAAIDRAREAEAKLAEVTKERDALRAQLASVVEDRAECLRRLAAHVIDPSPLTPDQEAKVEAAIGPRQPDGYDPGARTGYLGDLRGHPAKPEKAADPHAWAKPGTSLREGLEAASAEVRDAPEWERRIYAANRAMEAHIANDVHSWAKPGVWAVAEMGEGRVEALRLTRPQAPPAAPHKWWGVRRSRLSGLAEVGADLHVRRPATPEETARFEAELARNTAPAPIPLAVGQRWVWDEERPSLDSTIIRVDGGMVHAHDDESPWSEAGFRFHHPRLRDTSELEPAPDTGWGPKQVAEVTIVTSGPPGEPAPEPLVKFMDDGSGGSWFGPASMFKEPLPVIPNTCGECRRFCKTTMGTWCCGTPNAMQWCAGDRPPPFWCPLRTTKPKETT